MILVLTTSPRPSMLNNLHYCFTRCPDDSSGATPTTNETITPEGQSMLMMTAARQRLLPLKTSQTGIPIEEFNVNPLALRVWPVGVVLADPSNSNGFGGHMSSSRAAVYRAPQHRSRSASVCLVISDLTELPSFSHGLSTQHFFRRGQTSATC